MKTIIKIFIISILAIIWGSPLIAQNQIKIDKQQAWKIVREQVLKKNYDNVNVYVSKDVLLANQELEKIRKVNSPSYPSFFSLLMKNPMQTGHIHVNIAL